MTKKFYVLEKCFDNVEFMRNEEGIIEEFYTLNAAEKYKLKECQNGQVIKMKNKQYNLDKVGEFIVIEYMEGLEPEIIKDEIGNTQVFNNAKLAYLKCNELNNGEIYLLGEQVEEYEFIIGNDFDGYFEELARDIMSEVHIDMIDKVIVNAYPLLPYAVKYDFNKVDRSLNFTFYSALHAGFGSLTESDIKELQQDLINYSYGTN